MFEESYSASLDKRKRKPFFPVYGKKTFLSLEGSGQFCSGPELGTGRPTPQTWRQKMSARPNLPARGMAAITFVLLAGCAAVPDLGNAPQLEIGRAHV